MKNALNRFLSVTLRTTALACLCGLTSSLQAETNPRSLLHEELSTEAQVWLETQGEKFLALWEPDTSGSSFGAILLLHGEGQTPDWPDTINPLRTTLMQFGWSTLAIELSDSIVENNETLAQAHIQAAVNFLNEEGQQNLVMFGAGLNAARAMTYLLTQPAKPQNGKQAVTPAPPPTRGAFRALIMVNARELLLPQDFYLPTLDLYFDEHYLDTTEVHERLLLAKKYQLPHYHQLRLLRPAAPEYGEENRLTRRVRGFLNKYAKGVEIKRK